MACAIVHEAFQSRAAADQSNLFAKGQVIMLHIGEAAGLVGNHPQRAQVIRNQPINLARVPTPHLHFTHHQIANRPTAPADEHIEVHLPTAVSPKL